MSFCFLGRKAPEQTGASARGSSSRRARYVLSAAPRIFETSVFARSAVDASPMSAEFTWVRYHDLPNTRRRTRCFGTNPPSTNPPYHGAKRKVEQKSLRCNGSLCVAAQHA